MQLFSLTTILKSYKGRIGKDVVLRRREATLNVGCVRISTMTVVA
jgi:hypothetical protein